jgi:site-specific DNA recombinase
MTTDASQAPATTSPELKHAVLYLRVSTPRQMHTAVDIDPEGNSIATQREFGQRRALSISAAVEKEFIEPGNSAQSIEKRPVFRELLRYIADHPEIDFVIIYMRSRAFRNFTDAAVTKRQLAKLGVKLISAKENFGEGYVADAMEGIIDIFNEMEVRRNGEDIKAKLHHKRLNGGTTNRAKLGYLNIRAEQDGKLFNTIGLDERRAPLVLKAWELYATGEYSIDRLEAAMADLGLTTRPSGRWPREQPVSDSKLHRMLADPYYAGWVVVDGQLIKGRHPAIVTQELFDRVQDVLAARSKGGNRDRILQHYLKGMLYCERCRQAGRTSRLVYTEAKGRNGQYYGYFLCRARQDSDCDLPHLPAWQVEDIICRHYKTLPVPDDFATAVRDQLNQAMDSQQQLTRELHDKLAQQLAKLEVREQRLIDLAADGVLDRGKILERSNAIQTEKARIQASLTDTSAELVLGAERLRQCLDLVADPARLYANASDGSRRQLNGTFYRRFYLNDDPLAVTWDELNPPFDEIREAVDVYQRYKALTVGARPGVVTPLRSRGGVNHKNRRPNLAVAAPDDRTPVLADIFPVRVSSKRVVVELRGFEPLTPSMRRVI